MFRKYVVIILVSSCFTSCSSHFLSDYVKPEEPSVPDEMVGVWQFKTIEHAKPDCPLYYIDFNDIVETYRIEGGSEHCRIRTRSENGEKLSRYNILFPDGFRCSVDGDEIGAFKFGTFEYGPGCEMDYGVVTNVHEDSGKLLGQVDVSLDYKCPPSKYDYEESDACDFSFEIEADPVEVANEEISQSVNDDIDDLEDLFVEKCSHADLIVKKQDIISTIEVLESGYGDAISEAMQYGCNYSTDNVKKFASGIFCYIQAVHFYNDDPEVLAAIDSLESVDLGNLEESCAAFLSEEG